MNCWILVLLLFCCGNNRSGENECGCNGNTRNRRCDSDSCNVISESVGRRERTVSRESDRDCDNERDRDRDWDRDSDRERRGEQECDCQRANSYAEPRLEPRQFISYQTNRDCGCE